MQSDEALILADTVSSIPLLINGLRERQNDMDFTGGHQHTDVVVFHKVVRQADDGAHIEGCDWTD